jgi:hypothetical protein
VCAAKGVFVSIADGREKNGIRMPAWRTVLTDQEIWARFVLPLWPRRSLAEDRSVTA